MENFTHIIIHTYRVKVERYIKKKKESKVLKKMFIVVVINLQPQYL